MAAVRRQPWVPGLRACWPRPWAAAAPSFLPALGAQEASLQQRPANLSCEAMATCHRGARGRGWHSLPALPRCPPCGKCWRRAVSPRPDGHRSLRPSASSGGCSAGDRRPQPTGEGPDAGSSGSVESAPTAVPSSAGRASPAPPLPALRARALCEGSLLREAVQLLRRSSPVLWAQNGSGWLYVCPGDSGSLVGQGTATQTQPVTHAQLSHAGAAVWVEPGAGSAGHQPGHVQRPRGSTPRPWSRKERSGLT